MLHALYCFLYGFSDMLIRMEIISKDVRKISRTVKLDDDTEQREIDPYDEYFIEEYLHIREILRSAQDDNAAMPVILSGPAKDLFIS